MLFTYQELEIIAKKEFSDAKVSEWAGIVKLILLTEF